MRILHLTSHLRAGGITTHVTDLATAFARRRHQVIVGAAGGPWAERLESAGVAHWPLPLDTSAEFSLSVAWAAHRLMNRLRRGPVEVIHAHTRVGQVVADRLSTRLGIPYVTTWHGFYRRRLSRRLWPCTGRLTIAISEPVAEHLRTVFGVPASRIRLIRHGIDVARFAAPADEAARRQWRERLGLEESDRVVGTMARLVASKGVDQLIEAFAGVRTDCPSAKLLLVGDGEDRPRLAQLAQRLNVSEAVRFAGAVIDTRTVLSLMDVFVFLPADREGFGLSLLEAMAMARPIVAVRRGGGSTWALEETGVGRLVPPDDPRQLADAIRVLLDTPAAAAELGRRARAIVTAQYNLDRVVSQVEQVYAECLSG